MLHDFRYGIRLLIKNPSFTAIAVLTLALGIGANSAIFSIANALLVKPFPFDNLDRLVVLRESLPDQSAKMAAVSPADFADWREQNSAFQELAAYRVSDMTITGSGEPELLGGSLVSSEFFRAVHVHALKGRTFSDDESQPGRDRVAILGYGLWQRRFGGDPNILGQTMTIDGRSVSVVGIMSPYFDFPFGTELWMPLALTTQQMAQRDRRNLQVMAHLKPQVSVVQAQTEMLAIAKRIEQQYPQTNTGLTVQVIALRDQQAYFTGPLISVLFAMSGLLLLIACANVANLLFARGTTRQKEIAIRMAIGASRWVVTRQLMIESLLLTCLAGGFGLLLSVWAADLIKGSLPPDIARYMSGWKEIGVDGRVLAFTVAAAFITVLMFSLVPALQASRPKLHETLKEAGRQSGSTVRGSRVRTLLVISETALALVLLVAAGLMVKGFWRILNNFHGANPDSILTVHTSLPSSKYKERQKTTQFYDEAISRMESLPGVASVGAASNTPLNNRPNPSLEFNIEGQPPLPPGERYLSDLVVISPNYFQTIGLPLLTGREFSKADGNEAPPVAVISELMARRYWPQEEPVGARFRFSNNVPTAQWITIVGVVRDVRQSWFDREIRPQVYLPYPQAPQQSMHLMLRGSVEPMSLAAAAMAEIHIVDPDQVIDEAKTLGRLFIDEGSPFRFAAVLVLAFGALALVLSAVGLYSVMSYSVAQRTHEIGVRVALGARQADVTRLIVGQGIRTAVFGLLLGTPVAYLVSRAMASMLFGIVAVERPVLIGLVLLLGAVAFVSSYLPARRAARVDPIAALRCQ